MTYYHVAIVKKGEPKDYVFLFDLSLFEVGQEVLMPISKHQQIMCKGKIVQHHEIESYRISETEKPAREIIGEERKSTDPSRLEWLVITVGKDVTDLLEKKFIHKGAEISGHLFNYYREGINRIIEKLTTNTYDCLASFDHSDCNEMLRKIGKLHCYNEVIGMILPEDLNRNDLSNMSRHISFMSKYYDKKDFEWFKSNANDVTERDIPSLKKNIDDYFDKNFSSKTETEIFSFEPKITSSESINALEEAQRKIEKIFNRFHLVVKELSDRYDNRTPLKMDDEYDVQDLLEGLLKVEFEDVRREDHTPLLAGSSTRIDFVLVEEKIGIEVKRTRPRLDDKELGNELIEDVAHYTEHPSCKMLYFFVYDPEERIKNPRSIEKDLHRKYDFVRVFITPKRG